jgi:heterodisulfide reductase subunit B
MRYLYYPGCSLKGTAVDYEESFLAVTSVLGVEIQEIEDWQCCGASVAKSVDKDLSETLPAKTLVKAEKEGLDLLMPCSSCYLNHLQLVLKLREKGELRERFSLNRIPVVKHFLEVLAFDIGVEEINRRIVKPLKGIKALPYYGCLTVRPIPLGGRESIENPRAMEGVIETSGAQPLFFPYRVDCCGGTLLLSRERAALNLAATILKEAKRLSPDCIVVVCPLCHFMLDAKQAAVEKELGEKIELPVLYLTQLIGMAMGIDHKELGLQRLIVAHKKLLQKVRSIPSAERFS